MVRVGINGLGVMGRYLIRAVQDNSRKGILDYNDLQIVAFNDLFPADQLAPLLQHDSIYLGFPLEVKAIGKDININGKRLLGSQEPNLSRLNWDAKGVDIVYESSGAFTKKPKEGVGLEGHLQAGAKKVIISAPSDLAELTIVMGVNDEEYIGENIVSNASCTTNCLAPIAYALHREFGIKNGLMSTIHAYTSDQSLQDTPHIDPARAYAAALNIIPTSTGAAKSIGKVMKNLDNKLNGKAFRVPVPTASLVDLYINLQEEKSKKEINQTIEEVSNDYLKGTLSFEEGPIVSSRIIGNPTPSIFDASQTTTIGNLSNVVSYYDNVAGFSYQAIKLIKKLGDFIS